MLRLHTHRPVTRCPVNVGGGFRRAGGVDGQLFPFAIGLGFRLDQVEGGTGAPFAVVEEVVHRAFHPVNPTLISVHADGHIGLVDGDGLV
ncbi:hypothetical protein D3C79_779130 [compost metagenome]